MKILSLFDGMACGALAMQAAGIEIDKYIAYEVDKYAIQTAQHNFPFIEERGDVFKADFTEYAGFDYLIGGSPCTYWSIAQTKNRETVASGMGWELFSQYVRALHEAKPRFFLYENNKSMSAAIRQSITETFGFEPILINSALVSAQNRQRLYWCGIRQADGTYKKADIQYPADRGILLKDILETNGLTWQQKAYASLTEKEMDYMIRDHQDQRWSFCNKPGQEDKSKCLVANVYKGVPYNILAEPANVMKYELQSVENKDAGVVGILDMAGQEQIKRVYGTNGKFATLTTCQGRHREPKVFEKVAEPVQHCINEIELVNYKVRKDSVIVITDRNMRCAKNDLKHSSATESVVMLPNAKSNALITAHGVKVFEKIAEPYCVAQRGRYDESGKVFQHYEAQPTGKTNNLTTVSKDNLIAEPVGTTEQGKAFVLTANIDGKAVAQTAQSGGMGSNTGLYAEPLNADDIKYCNDKNIAHICRPFGSKAKVITENEKAPTLMAAMGTGGGNGVYYAENMKVREIKNAPIYEVKDGYITVKGNKYPIKLVDGFYIIRKLTVRECMRLQTVPEWYEWPVSKSQAYKMLGNGWTVEVIAHLLRGLK